MLAGHTFAHARDRILMYRMAKNFGRLAVLRVIRQYFICPKLHSVMSSLLPYHSLCTRPVAKRASLIVGIEFTIESCVRGHRTSKEFCTPKEKSWLACQREEGNPNDVYTVAVKTDETKTIQIMRNNDLVSFSVTFNHRLCPN